MPQNLNLPKAAVLTLSLFLLGIAAVNAQYPSVTERVQNLQDFDERFLHYGYYFGLNEFGFKFEYEKTYSAPIVLKGRGLPDIELVKNYGFNVGLIGDMRINKFLNLRFEPGLYYNQRDFIYPDATPGLSTDQDYLREIKSTYIHLPLLIKFSALRINNFKPYLVGGISTSFNLSSNKKSNDDNSNNVFRVISQTYNYEIGFGIDFYLPYFKFSPSIRGLFSVDNELIQDVDPMSPWTSNINNLYSQAILINFTFE
ncbi:MAG: PorT family protein [Flavobacteriaceae bacterium]|nr:PorT family protein [Candidatus Arcticimaribacter sp.]